MSRKLLLVVGLALIPIFNGCSGAEKYRARVIAEEAYKNEDVEKYNIAISLISKDLKDSPNDKELYILRGYYYSKSGKKKEAIDDLSKAIEIDPTSAHAYNNRCYNYYELKVM